MGWVDTPCVDPKRDVHTFVEDASRALRDPLTVCLSYLERLSDDPDERRRAVPIVLSELARMARIVDDLEDLVACDRPDFLRVETIDVATFTHELAEEASALGPRRWVVDRTGDGPMIGDRRRLTEAVMDLADNAVRHTLDGQTVAIGSSVSEDEARIWVRDTGCGIPSSDRARLFDLFARGEDAHRRYRGSGLSLAVVSAVVEAHGGRVEVESRLDEGSTFTLVLANGSPNVDSTTIPEPKER